MPKSLSDYSELEVWVNANRAGAVAYRIKAEKGRYNLNQFVNIEVSETDNYYAGGGVGFKVTCDNLVNVIGYPKLA